MLVTTGCLLERQACAGSAPGGVTVVVQPCGADRRPEGPARWLGPVEGAKEVRAVCRWIERGDWNAPLSVRWDAEVMSEAITETFPSDRLDEMAFGTIELSVPSGRDHSDRRGR